MEAQDLHQLGAVLLNPRRLWTRSELLVPRGVKCPASPEHGAYAWYFRTVPGTVPVEGCHVLGDWTLLYVGISPQDEDSVSGNLRKRIKKHLKNRAASSTLRRTLGALLRAELNIQACRSGIDQRFGFTKESEQNLSDWMEANAAVCWVECGEPWNLEKHLMKEVPLPFNLRDNSDHSFYRELKAERKAHRGIADQG